MTTATPIAPRTASWIIRPTPPRDAASRLFCFPFAGGAAATYRLWTAALPRSVEVCALALPARAHRLRETPIDSIPALVDSIVDAITPLLDKPFSFFGHSMGAIVSTEVARALHARGAPLPRHLFVSGRRPVHVPGNEALLHVLPDAELVTELNRRYGGIPAEVLQHADLMALLLPGLRADLKALETYRPAQQPALPIPLSVFGGLSDTLAPLSHLEAWHVETSRSFRVRQFEGGHFYIDSAREALLAEISATLASTTSSTQAEAGSATALHAVLAAAASDPASHAVSRVGALSSAHTGDVGAVSG